MSGALVAAAAALALLVMGGSGKRGASQDDARAAAALASERMNAAKPKPPAAKPKPPAAKPKPPAAKPKPPAAKPKPPASKPKPPAAKPKPPAAKPRPPSVDIGPAVIVFDEAAARRNAAKVAAHIREKRHGASRPLIAEWQRVAGLKPDGLYGRRTRRALLVFGAKAPPVLFAQGQDEYTIDAARRGAYL